jgi:hypothetical protein
LLIYKAGNRRLLDDADDDKGLRVNDDALVVDHGIGIGRILGDRGQDNFLRKRFTDDHLPLDHDRLSRDRLLLHIGDNPVRRRGDCGAGNGADDATYGGTNGTADNGTGHGTTGSTGDRTFLRQDRRSDGTKYNSAKSDNLPIHGLILSVDCH